MRDLVDFSVDYAERLGADYAEGRFQNDLRSMYLLVNGKPDVGRFTRASGIGIRVLVDGGLGFLSANKPNKELLKRRVEEAVKMARSSAKTMKKPTSLSSEKTFKERWDVKPKVSFEDVSVEEKMELLGDVDEAVSSPKEVGAKVVNRYFYFLEYEIEKYFLNSEGTEISSFLPKILFYGLLTASDPVKGTEQDSIAKGESRGWEAVRDWDLVSYAVEKARTLGRILKTAMKAPKGKVDVVLGTEVVGLMMHESAGHPYDADRILGREAAQAGESFITRDMIGQNIGPEIVTVVDDPTVKHSFGHYLYDDEGIPARRRFLIKNGVINEFLHNRETAYEMGVKSNGAARAEFFDREPIVRMANTFMLPGSYTFEELLEGVEYGVFMKTFGEWNIDDRRYNMRFIGRECYLIEKGKLGEMVRRPILEVTTPGFFSSIDALGKNLEFEGAICGKSDPSQGAPVWHGGPNVRVRDVELGGIK
ncbi:MAG: TldD/PmbA family protein [Candidatus Bathyarchaeia archaeon]